MGRGGGPDKSPTEELGGTPEGRGKGQSPIEVSGRSRPSVLFYSAKYTKRGGVGRGGAGADLRAASLHTASKPVKRPPRQPLPQKSPPYNHCSVTS